jgi:hypothetical protein
VARAGDEIVAGTVNVQKGDALYGRYWGALRPLRHLHFNVCYYAGIEQCIEQGLGRFEPGAGGESKQLRGFDPAADPQPASARGALTRARGRAHPRRSGGGPRARGWLLRAVSALKTTRA